MKINKNTEYLNDPLQVCESNEFKRYRVPEYRVALVREASIESIHNPSSVFSPKQVADIFMPHLHFRDREHFMILMLNTKNKAIGINTVSIGSLCASIVHPREIFKPAMIAGSASIILVHNHPSGDPSPSQEDLEVTKRLVDGGNLLGVAVRDHVIIGEGVWYSFREKGLI